MSNSHSKKQLSNKGILSYVLRKWVVTMGGYFELVPMFDFGIGGSENLLKIVTVLMLFAYFIEKKIFLQVHIVVCFWRDSPPVGQDLLIHEVF